MCQSRVARLIVGVTVSSITQLPATGSAGGWGTVNVPPAEVTDVETVSAYAAAVEEAVMMRVTPLSETATVAHAATNDSFTYAAKCWAMVVGVSVSRTSL